MSTYRKQAIVLDILGFLLLVFHYDFLAVSFIALATLAVVMDYQEKKGR